MRAKASKVQTEYPALEKKMFGNQLLVTNRCNLEIWIIRKKKRTKIDYL